MVDEKLLIAVASSDGIVVNNHFGKASKFFIYEVEDAKVRLVEERNVQPVCEGGIHDDTRLQENIDVFQDCDYILISRIGYGAAMAVEKAGIIAMELPGLILDSIDKLMKYREIQRNTTIHGIRKDK